MKGKTCEEPQLLSKELPEGQEIAEIVYHKEVQKEERICEKSDGAIEIKLKDLVQDLDDFDAILHKLNLEGEAHGVAFKKGTIRYWEGKKVKYKTIICSCKSRNSRGAKRKENRESLEQNDNMEIELPGMFFFTDFFK